MLSATAVAGSQFDTTNKMKTYELDGAQPAFLGMAVAQKFTLIETQWKIAGVQTHGVTGNVFSFISIVRRIIPFAKSLIYGIAKQQEEVDPQKSKSLKKFADRFVSVATDFERNTDKFMLKLAPHIETICAISAVAMIVFGHVAIGVIGLLAVVLTKVKQRNQLPAIVENILVPLTIISNFYAIAISPTFLIFRIINILGNGDDFLRYLSANPTTSKFLPNFLTKDCMPEHKIDPQRALEPLLTSEREVEDLLKDIKDSQTYEYYSPANQTFRINYSSFHHPMVKDIVPKEVSDTLKEVSADDLYKRIEERIRTTGIEIRHQQGWNRMKDSIKTGSLEDERPPNFEKTQDVIKAVLYELIQDEDAERFRQKVQELAKIGVACNEGWLREASFLLNPKSKDFKWQVHSHFARLRSSMLKESIQDFAKRMRDAAKTNKELSKVLNLFDMVGGENNIHFLNQIQGAVAHRWRSYDAEIYSSVHGRSIMARELIKRANSQLPKLFLEGGEEIKGPMEFLKRNWKPILTAESQITLPLPIPAFIFAQAVDEQLKYGLTPQRVIDYFYDRFKAQYFVDPAIDSPVQYRDIPWDSAQGWMYNLAERCGEGETAFSPEARYDLLVKRDMQDQPYLTKKGVALLLFDMGILERRLAHD